MKLEESKKKEPGMEKKKRKKRRKKRQKKVTAATVEYCPKCGCNLAAITKAFARATK